MMKKEPTSSLDLPHGRLEGKSRIPIVAYIDFGLTICNICGKQIRKDYPLQVCQECDANAWGDSDEHTRNPSPTMGADRRLADESCGPNPVFIGSLKCWRRYSTSGHITFLDLYDAQDLDSFFKQYETDQRVTLRDNPRPK